MPIGDFSRATFLSVKALRRYHQEDLLIPAEIDPDSGYRRYDVAQIPDAQVIKRLRELDMPLEEIRGILRTADLTERAARIESHLARLERELHRVSTAVDSLRDLLAPPAEGSSPIRHRHVPRTRVAAITDEVKVEDLGPWMTGAFGELYATLSSQNAPLTGDAGGVYADSLFHEEHGEATVYLPTDAPFHATGRVQVREFPASDVAVITHHGPHAGIDRAYGALADHVTRRTLAVDGPLREFYPVSGHHTADPSRWITEIGWPIFPTSPGQSLPTAVTRGAARRGLIISMSRTPGRICHPAQATPDSREPHGRAYGDRDDDGDYEHGYRRDGQPDLLDERAASDAGDSQGQEHHDEVQRYRLGAAFRGGHVTDTGGAAHERQARARARYHGGGEHQRGLVNRQGGGDSRPASRRDDSAGGQAGQVPEPAQCYLDQADGGEHDEHEQPARGRAVQPDLAGHLGAELGEQRHPRAAGDRAQAGDEETLAVIRHPEPPEPAAGHPAGPAHGLRHQPHPGQADREQDQDQQVRGPGRHRRVRDEGARDQRAERRTRGDTGGIGERGETAVAARLKVHQRGARGPVDDASEDSLHGPAGQEHGQVDREHHDQHRGRDAEQRRDERRAAAEPVRQRAEQQQRHDRAE
jgi:DNA-binding transcriptional MerR regulator